MGILCVGVVGCIVFVIYNYVVFVLFFNVDFVVLVLNFVDFVWCVIFMFGVVLVVVMYYYWMKMFEIVCFIGEIVYMRIFGYEF